MAKITLGHGGVNSVGPEMPERYPYAIVEQYSKHGSIRPVKLKKGEIIHGTVVDIPAPREAMVRLPVGTLHAVLHGRLKRGDSLFLKVIETTPGLVLRVYSVSVMINGKEVSTEDIIRILDLPDNLFFAELIKHFRKSASSIVRDDMIKLEKYFLELEEENVKDMDLDEAFDICEFIFRNNLQFSNQSFLKFKKIISHPAQRLKMELLSLEKLQNFMPDFIKNQLAEIFKYFRSRSTSLHEFLWVLSFQKSDGNVSPTLYEVLSTFVKISPKLMVQQSESETEKNTALRQQALQELRKRSENILETLEAQYIYNYFADKNKKPLRLLVPLLFKDFEIFLFLIDFLSSAKSPHISLIDCSDNAMWKSFTDNQSATPESMILINETIQKLKQINFLKETLIQSSVEKPEIADIKKITSLKGRNFEVVI